MGVPGQFKKPTLLAGRLRDLNDALHTLHLLAGRPSLDTMSRLLGQQISRTRLHDAFTEPRLPPWDTVEALVEILATRAPDRTPQGVLPEVHALWVLASLQSTLLDPTRREILDEVTEAFALQLGRRPGELDVDAPIADLGGDSLVVLEATGSLERSFGITFGYELYDADTLTEIADLLQKTLRRDGR